MGALMHKKRGEEMAKKYTRYDIYTYVIDVGTRGGAHEEGAHTHERHATPRPK